MGITFLRRNSFFVPCIRVRPGAIYCGMALSYLILGRESCSFRSLGLLVSILVFMASIPFASEEPLPLPTVTFPIVLLKSLVVGSPTRPRIPTAERTFNTNSWSLLILAFNCFRFFLLALFCLINAGGSLHKLLCCLRPYL